jgi:hypothetical protein
LVKEIIGVVPKAASASADRDKLQKQLGSRMVQALILEQPEYEPMRG